MDDRNEKNTKVIVLNEKLTIEESFKEEYRLASSAHLEMIKVIKRKLQDKGLRLDNVRVDNIRDAALDMASLLEGLVIQVFPNAGNSKEVLAVIYFEGKELKEGVLSNLLEVYNSLINSKIDDELVCLKGVLFSPLGEMMECYPVEASDTEDNLNFLEIVSNLPFKKSKERK